MYIMDLIDASRTGEFCQRLFKALLKKKYNPNLEEVNTGNTALHWCAASGPPDICLLLLRYGADVNKTNKSLSIPLHFAADKGNDRVLAVLINSGSNINYQNDNFDSPLHLSCQRGHVRTCEILLQKGADTACVNLQGRTPIQVAQSAHNSQIVKLFHRHMSGKPKN